MKIRLSVYFILLLSAFFNTACSDPKSVSEPELISFISDPSNGLRQQATHEHVKIIATYYPADLLIARELRGASQDSLTLEAAKKKYHDHLYFKISFSQNDHDPLDPAVAGERFGSLLQTFSFGMSQLIAITTAQNGVVPPADVLFTRSFGISRSADILVSFLKKDLTGTSHFELSIEEFGLGTGRVKFSFNQFDLNTIPRIKHLHTL